MNAIEQARQGYAPAYSPLLSHRSAEYRAFSRVTARLRLAASNETSDFPALAAALHDNRMLWTVLADDVVGNDNSLPDALRARVFYLAEFTTHHSRKILAGTASADVLVEINAAVMRGLSGLAPVEGL